MSSLPAEVEVPSELQECALSVRGLVMHWMCQGAVVPFSMGDLAVAAKKSEDTVQEVLKLLLGNLWTHWFPSHIGAERILPKQAVFYMHRALESVLLQGRLADATAMHCDGDAPAQEYDRIWKARRLL